MKDGNFPYSQSVDRSTTKETLVTGVPPPLSTSHPISSESGQSGQQNDLTLRERSSTTEHIDGKNMSSFNDSSSTRSRKKFRRGRSAESAIAFNSQRDSSLFLIPSQMMRITENSDVTSGGRRATSSLARITTSPNTPRAEKDGEVDVDRINFPLREQGASDLQIDSSSQHQRQPNSSSCLFHSSQIEQQRWDRSSSLNPQPLFSALSRRKGGLTQEHQQQNNQHLEHHQHQLHHLEETENIREDGEFSSLFWTDYATTANLPSVPCDNHVNSSIYPVHPYAHFFTDVTPNQVNQSTQTSRRQHHRAPSTSVVGSGQGITPETTDEVLIILRYLLWKTQTEDDKSRTVNDWRLLAQAVDRILFWLFTLITIISSVSFLVLIPIQRRGLSFLFG